MKHGYISKFMILFVKRIKERGGDGIGMGINAFHEGTGVEIVDFGFDFMEAIVFSIGGGVVDRDHKADMTDVTLGLERAGRVFGLAFSQAA